MFLNSSVWVLCGFFTLSPSPIVPEGQWRIQIPLSAKQSVQRAGGEHFAHSTGCQHYHVSIKESKCDYKFLKVGLLWVWRLVWFGKWFWCLQSSISWWLCGLAEVQAVLGPPALHCWRQKGPLGTLGSPSDCCFSGAALVGLTKCITVCLHFPVSCYVCFNACVTYVSMQHADAVYQYGKWWGLYFGCFLLLLCYKGCVFTGKKQA